MLAMAHSLNNSWLLLGPVPNNLLSKSREKWFNTYIGCAEWNIMGKLKDVLKHEDAPHVNVKELLRTCKGEPKKGYKNCLAQKALIYRSYQLSPSTTVTRQQQATLGKSRKALIPRLWSASWIFSIFISKKEDKKLLVISLPLYIVEASVWHTVSEDPQAFFQCRHHLEEPQRKLWFKIFSPSP